MTVFEIKKILKKEIKILIILEVFTAIFLIILKEYRNQVIHAICIILFIISCITMLGTIKQLWQINIFLKKKILKENEKILSYCMDSYMTTDKYLILFFPKVKMIKYTDIILIYKQAVFSAINLVIVTFNKRYIIRIEDLGYSYIGQIGELKRAKDCSPILLEKNPNILIGNTKENRRILFEKYNIKLDSRFKNWRKSIFHLIIGGIVLLIIGSLLFD